MYGSMECPVGEFLSDAPFFELSLWTMCFANELRMHEWVELYPWTYAAKHQWAKMGFHKASGRVSLLSLPQWSN